MSRTVFRDRVEAGAALGAALVAQSLDRPLDRTLDRPVVLGLPRGGVPVAAAVARALQAPLDVIVVRKLGVPYQREVAMGAIGEDGVVIINRDVVRMATVSEQELSRVEREEREVLDARLVRLRAIRKREPLEGRTALLVDDGIATGATMRAAVQVARAHGAARVVVAAPVAPPEVVEMMRAEADEVIVLEQPDPFWAVGTWYRNFDAVSDDEVADLLRAGLAGAQSSAESSAESGAGDRGDTSADPPLEREVQIPSDGLVLHGDLVVPEHARGIVVFAHGSGSSRHSPRNRWVADQLQQAGLATLLMDLLTEAEARYRGNVFDVALLAARVGDAVSFLDGLPETKHLPVGLFGASTGAAAALCAAALPQSPVRAVVSRGGRPDLAEDDLGAVRAPTLLIVGGDDGVVVSLNRQAAAHLQCAHRVLIVPGATHLFEEPGTLEQVAQAATDWFLQNLGGAAQPGG